jgi:hypothetical protein
MNESVNAKVLGCMEDTKLEQNKLGREVEEHRAEVESSLGTVCKDISNVKQGVPENTMNTIK